MKKVSIVILIGIVLAIAFIAGRCSNAKERSQQIANLRAARDSVKNYSVEINGLKISVSEKDAVILTERDAKKAGLLEVERLKKLHVKEVLTNAELKGIIKVQQASLDVPPETVFKIIKDTTGITNEYIKIPFTLLRQSEKYLTLNAGMDSSRKAWFDLKVPVDGTMTIGYVKDGFLKRKAAGVFTSENPYLKINKMDILIVEDPKKWHEKWWIHVIAGGAIVEGINLLTK